MVAQILSLNLDFHPGILLANPHYLQRANCRSASYRLRQARAGLPCCYWP